jgi:hypothetical protein
MFDGNHDGILGREEADTGLGGLGLSWQDRFTSLALLDFSRDGVLSLSEVCWLSDSDGLLVEYFTRPSPSFENHCLSVCAWQGCVVTVSSKSNLKPSQVKPQTLTSQTSNPESSTVAASRANRSARTASSEARERDRLQRGLLHLILRMEPPRYTSTTPKLKSRPPCPSTHSQLCSLPPDSMD